MSHGNTGGFPRYEEISSAFVVSGVGMDELLFTLFAGIGLMTVLFQFIPGIMLLSSMMKSIIYPTEGEIKTTAKENDIAC